GSLLRVAVVSPEQDSPALRDSRSTVRGLGAWSLVTASVQPHSWPSAVIEPSISPSAAAAGLAASPVRARAPSRTPTGLGETRGIASTSVAGVTDRCFRPVIYAKVISR